MSDNQKPDNVKNDIQRYNHLAAAEMDEEGNYNMIDGVINNSKKPSILEYLRNHKPPAAGNGERPERDGRDER